MDQIQVAGRLAIGFVPARNEDNITRIKCSDARLNKPLQHIDYYIIGILLLCQCRSIVPCYSAMVMLRCIVTWKSAMVEGSGPFSRS